MEVNEFEDLEGEIQNYNNDLDDNDIIAENVDDYPYQDGSNSKPGSFVGYPDEGIVDADLEYRSNSDHNSIIDDEEIGVELN